MPTYEYECPACKEKFDVTQKMNDPALDKCPKCKRKGVRRLIGSGSGIIFKGSGFYATDYKKQDKKRDSQLEKSANTCPKAAGGCNGCPSMGR